MPEGPSTLIMKEAVEKFIGEKVRSASGNAKIEMKKISGKLLLDYKTWGKQSFLIFDDFAVRIHLLMFGSYSVGEQTKPERSLRLHLEFLSGNLYFYTCSVKLVDLHELAVIDWKADVLSDDWDEKAAKKKLKAKPEMMVCDALLDQNIFAGVGNIIKNEVLFRIGVQPESLVGNLPKKKLDELVYEARNYSFDFLKWKKEFTLKKHWLAHTKKTCPKCGEKLTKKHCGITNRRSFFCENDQKLY